MQYEEELRNKLNLIGNSITELRHLLYKYDNYLPFEIKIMDMSIKDLIKTAKFVLKILEMEK